MKSKTNTQQYFDFHDQRAKALFDARVIHLVGSINMNLAAELSISLAHMETDGKKPIDIHLNTYGGEIYSGLAMYDRILLTRKAGVSVTIFAIGACMSAGTFILQAANKRVATPNTSFLLHELRGHADGTLSEQEDRRKENKRVDKAISTIICTRSGLSEKEFNSRIRRKDSFFGADEALKLGLIDEVVEVG